MARTVHIVGAGLAGLAAAVRLTETGARVVLHEATDHPGGRCRSYHDRAIGMTIDNGNHLVLSGNHAVRDFLRAIGSEAGLVGPAEAAFPFADLATGRRWMLRINDGRLPWWIFSRARRVPDTSSLDYLRLAPLLFARDGRAVGETIRCEGALHERLIAPLLVAALNVAPQEGAAALASAVVRETLGAGGAACRPLIARDGLGPVFIEPALAHLSARGGTVHLSHELRALRLDGERVAGLDFGGDAVDLGPGDAVILAVPTHAAAALVPGLVVPEGYRPIANAHFRIDAPAHIPPITGIINGTMEWLFAFEGRLSVTISNAGHVMDMPREDLARKIWSEIATLTGLPSDLPPWQIVRERRATFVATPEQNARRPGPRTRWRNLLLAGDWTQTGLPATLEGATRSGFRAADLAIAGAA